MAGGMRGCRGHACLRVEHAWLRGVMCGCGGACVVAEGVCVGYDEIRSMSGRYASYWNAFLFIHHLCQYMIPYITFSDLSFCLHCIYLFSISILTIC